MHSAFVEQAGEWMVFPGESPNMLLELRHAQEWLVDPNAGALARVKQQDSVKRVD